MLDPGIIVPDNILILQPRLNVDLSLNDLVILLPPPTQLHQLNAVNISIDAITHLINLTLTTLAEFLNLFKVLPVSSLRDNWELEP